MTRNKRLSSEVRKNEIMSSAAKFFIEKGFSQTSMEDVISGTSMSKGGVYHYYKNTLDILHDLMIAGNNYRIDIIKKAVKAYRGGCDVHFLALEIVEKMLDDNTFMPIYVAFLIESKKNDKLNALYQKLRKETTQEYLNISDSINQELLYRATDDFIMNLTNSVIIGAELLGARDCFVENKDILIAMIEYYLEHNFENLKEGR